MAVRELNFESIAAVDGGRVVAAIDAAIKQCVRDVEDRPRNPTVRQVQISLGIKPGGKDTAEDDVVFGFAINVKLPKGESSVIAGKIRRLPGKGFVVAFNDLTQENPDQLSLDDESPKAWGDQSEE